ncbi:uncharacterized protein LOC142571292 [Dermacentor variabilis]|uniref:uncharacterized protein LOC142571292 n=1 Tax=Dermacentor variabilis TaxID=34621 RepID=UPI003F5BD12F
MIRIRSHYLSQVDVFPYHFQCLATDDEFVDPPTCCAHPGKRGQGQTTDHDILEKRWRHEQALKDKEVTLEEKRTELEKSRLAPERGVCSGKANSAWRSFE